MAPWMAPWTGEEAGAGRVWLPPGWTDRLSRTQAAAIRRPADRNAARRPHRPRAAVIGCASVYMCPNRSVRGQCKGSTADVPSDVNVADLAPRRRLLNVRDR